MVHLRYWLAACVVGAWFPSLVSAELAISGVDVELERNIRAFSTLATEPCDAEPWLIRRRYRALDTEARKALEPFGFYDPVITSEMMSDDNCWHATLIVDPGEPVRYREVSIAVDGEASTDTVFDSLKVSDTLVPDAAVRHADYDRLKKAFQIRAADRGYFEARFLESKLDIWPEQHAADVTVRFDSGPRYRIGDLQVEQDFLDPKIVFGYLDLEPGSYFDTADLARARRDLADSAYFGDIQISPDIDNAADGEVPVRITLQPGTRIEYTLGVGASTDTGARFRAGFRNNRLNKRGHRLIADLGVATVIQGITTEYRIPLRDPRREWFSVTAAVSNEDNDTFDNDAQRIGLRWTKAMSDTWLRTLSLDASNESFAVADNVDTSRFIVPGVAFDQKISDRDIFPSRGRRLGAEIRGTDESLGSTTSYVQATAWLRWIRSFGEGNRILTRVNAGVTASKDFSRLPPSVRFFAGGDESVRGFDYESLGPTDAEGNVIGGRNMLVASIEYERHLRGNFYGAVFVDAGNAFDNTNLDAEVGAGIGLKWRSPVGPLRFYLGYPLTADDGNVRLHLTLGADL